jgi:hypothetical protein
LLGGIEFYAASERIGIRVITPTPEQEVKTHFLPRSKSHLELEERIFDEAERNWHFNDERCSRLQLSSAKGGYSCLGNL